MKFWLNVLVKMDLFGYIFKSDLLSCGMEWVWVYWVSGIFGKNGVGIFVWVLMDWIFLLLVEEEGWLYDLFFWENFIE